MNGADPTTGPTARRPSAGFVLALLGALALGAWLRLDQFGYQVLDGDEWHAVHRLLHYRPLQTMATFGHADHSIPVVLYYHLLALLGPIDEVLMRLPMMVAGIATIVALPWMLRRQLPAPVLALWALLLATSPFLIYFSRQARPYAITTLGVWVALYLLYLATTQPHYRWRYATLHALLSAFLIWMLPVVGPFLAAPLLSLWLQWAWRHRPAAAANRKPQMTDWSARDLLKLCLTVAVFTALLVAPPLLLDGVALTDRANRDTPTWTTWPAAFQVLIGSTTLATTALFTAFVLMGFVRASQMAMLGIWLIAGVALLIGAVSLSKPLLSNLEIVMARYLAPAQPLLLLLFAHGFVFGISRLHRRLSQMSSPTAATTTAAAILTVLAIGWTLQSPLPQWMRRPQSSLSWAGITWVYNPPEPALIAIRSNDSPYWLRARESEPDSQRIAVAPNHQRHVGFFWGIYWETLSRQRVIPAFTSGICSAAVKHEALPATAERSGDQPAVPIDLRNAVHIDNIPGMRSRGVTQLAYYHRAPLVLGFDGMPRLPDCEKWLFAHYGPPDYADQYLWIWNIKSIGKRSRADI